MCCPLCEEPVRSVLFGLSAIGVVAIIRVAQKSVKQFTSKRLEAPNAQAEAAGGADSAS